MSSLPLMTTLSVLFSLSYSTELKSKFLSRIDFENTYDPSFYHDLSDKISETAEIKELGIYTSSPFVFDRDCISVVKTNTALEVQCQLPEKCGAVYREQLSKTWYGQEILFCYSFHQSQSQSVSKFSTLKFSPVQFSYIESLYERNPAKTYYNILPQDFFDHLVINIQSDSYNVMPKICMEHYTSVNSKFPPSVTYQQNEDTLCVFHSIYDHLDCQPKHFTSIREIVRFYDFPISYDGNPYNLVYHSRYKNQDPDVYEYSKTFKHLHPMSNNDGVIFVSHVPLRNIHAFLNNTPNFIYYPDKDVKSVDSESYCYPIQALYKNPLSSLASAILELVKPLLLSVFEFLEHQLERIAKLVLRFLLLMLNILFELVNSVLTGSVISSIFCSLAIYFYYRDLFITFVFFVCFLLLFIFIL